MPYFRFILFFSLLVNISNIPLIASAAKSNSNSEPLLHLGNGIAAVAEGEIITFEQLRKSIDPMIPKMRLQAKDDIEFSNIINELSKEILNNMIDRIIIVKQAADEGIQIPPSYIDQEYDKIIRDDFNGNRSQFLSYLEATGKTPLEFRDELSNKLIVNVMRSRMSNEIPQVSPEKIESYYIENKLRFYQPSMIHLKQIILIPDNNNSFESLSELSNEIYRKLSDGTPIENMANTYGNKKYNRPNGDWGWIKREDMRPELAKIAFELKAKHHSKPVIINDAIFILYAESIKQQMIQPISQVRDLIENMLEKELANEALERWLSELRERAYVRYFIEV